MRKARVAVAALAVAAVAVVPASASMRAAPLDAQFLQSSIRTDLFEIAGSRLAAPRATSGNAKNLAAVVGRDHQKALDRTARLAKSMHVSVPGTPSAAQHWELHVLTTQQGTAFDKLYGWLEEARHGDAIVETQAAAAGASNPAVRALARSLLPTLRAHLKMATVVKSGA